MDVSEAVDALFAGVVPERVEEMKATWGKADRVRLLDVSRFLLQANFGSIQVSEKALRLIWLTGYAAWAAVDEYNVRIVCERLNEAAFDPAAWNSYPQQRQLDNEFDRLLGKVRELDSVETLEDFAWPEGVPQPVDGLRITNVEKKATYDLICMAGAFVFGHELRHALLDHDERRPDRPIDEERECDSWALALMLSGVPDYAVATNQIAEAVRAKRILGVVFAQLAIVVLTPRQHWDETDSHPAVRERLRAVLDAAVDPVPEWFWTTVSSMLAAFARRLNVLPPPMPFPPTDRELAYALCDGLRAA